MIIGFVVGAIIFSIGNHILKKSGSKEKNSSDNTGIKDTNQYLQDNNKYQEEDNQNDQKKKRVTNSNNSTKESDEEDQEKDESLRITGGTSAKAIVVGSLMDNIPEALFVGILVALNHQGITAAVSALFLGNLVTTIEGAKRMHERGKSVSRIMLRWGYIFLAVVIAAPLGYSFVKTLTNPEISIILGFASGALISLITEELIPEAYKKAKYHIGLSTTFGFLVGYLLFHFF